MVLWLLARRDNDFLALEKIPVTNAFRPDAFFRIPSFTWYAQSRSLAYTQRDGVLCTTSDVNDGSCPVSSDTRLTATQDVILTETRRHSWPLQDNPLY